MDVFQSPAQVLQQLSENLQQLLHLDLSGTNLPGVLNGSIEQSALPGWPSDRKLSFLGLLGCPSDASLREHLPAHRIAGEANEEQLVGALEAYADRRLATRTILKSLYNLVNDPNPHLTIGATEYLFELVLERMHHYLNDTRVQILASASLFRLIRLIDMEIISPMRVRTLVQSLVDTLERYAADQTSTLVRNCLLILVQVRTYDQIRTYDLLYKRLLKVLLRIAQRSPNAIALDLLRNILLQQIHLPECKLLFGKLGGVQVTLSILEQLLESNDDYGDTLADKCWWLLDIATDEMAHNCKLFIDRGGLELFVRCLKKWPGHNELYSTMFIVVGNVSDAKCLRGVLKNDQLLTIFLEMLDMRDDKEISYVTAYVLSQLLADGEDLWHYKAGCDDAPLSPVALAYSHAAIGERIIATIDKWDPNVDLDLSYTSLLPCLSLITSFTSFASQYWAAWALNNLTFVHPEKYCPMFLREAALDFLDTTIADTRSPDKLRHWLVLTADRIREYIKEQASGDRSGASSSHVLLVADELMDPDESDDTD